MEAIEAAKAQGGIGGRLKRMGLSLSGGFAFLRLFMLPVKQNKLPENIRLHPAW